MISLLLLAVACGDKDDGPTGDGGSTDGGTGGCELELAGSTDVEAAYCEALVDKLLGVETLWQWTGDTTYPDYNSIWSMPAVGDVTGDGVPDIVFTSAYYTYYNDVGLVIVLDGATGEQLQMFEAAGEKDYISASAGVALGDLDGDGIVEIVTFTYGGSLVAFQADGTELWVSEVNEDYDFTLWSAPALGDIDGDGQMEILAGRSIYNSSGELVVQGPEEAWGGILFSGIIADLDANGTAEAIVGCQAFDIEGELIWSSCDETGDGNNAVGDFDGDGKGEVVIANWEYGTVSLVDDDGGQVWKVTLWEPYATGYAGGGGPPTVADFNGDGELEIALRGADSVVVLDKGGNTLWSVGITESFAYLGGVTAFDFDDDGVLEVVVADETALWLLNGETGETTLSIEEHAGYSIMNYPVVSDVDGDGRANIVLPSNNGGDDWTGLTVLSDVYNSWSPSRQIWHQHGTFPDEIGADLKAPSTATTPWEDGGNMYRAMANGERGKVYAAAPDLVPTVTDSCLDCNSTYTDFQLAVQVANIGAVDQELPFGVGVYGVTADGRRELIDTASFDVTLRAGRTTDSIMVFGRYASSVGFVALEVQVDGAQVREAENLGDALYLDCNSDDVVSVPLDDC